MKILALSFFTMMLICCQVEDEIKSPDEVLFESIDQEAVPDLDRMSIDSAFQLTHLLIPEEGCFPGPSERFKGWMKTDSIWLVMESSPHIIYTYLAYHFDSLEARQITETDDFWGAIAWSQKFSNGFYFERMRYPEAGGDGLLKTPCTNRASFYKTFIELTNTEDNSWNSDSTKYEPDGAGCYYKIKVEEDETYSVSWYCGC